MGIKLIISISLSLYSLWNLPSLVLVHISSRKVPVCSEREQNSLYALPSVRTAPGWVLGWGQAAPTSPMQSLGSMKSYLPHIPAIGSPCSMSQESLFEPSRFTPLCTKSSENKRHFCLERLTELFFHVWQMLSESVWGNLHNWYTTPVTQPEWLKVYFHLGWFRTSQWNL